MTESTSRSEEFQFSGDTLLAKIKEIIREGNIRRVVIKNEDGRVLIDIPLTIGVVGTLLAPQLAAIGAIAALVLKGSIVIEKETPPAASRPCEGLSSLIACLAAPALSFASVDEYLLAVTHDLAPAAKEAVQRIDGQPRQLLAVRGYLRAGKQLPSRWSWSADEIRTYEASQEYRDLLAEIATVRARFEAANPGYSLYANTTARSLDLQLQRWNSNKSVGVIAERLHEAAVRELGAYPAHPGCESDSAFRGLSARVAASTLCSAARGAGLVAARALARDRLSDRAGRADHCAHRSREGALGVGRAGLGEPAGGGDARHAFRRTAAIAERALAL